MSDDILSIIPTDPHWQPVQDAADRAAAIMADLAPGEPDGVDAEIDVTWHDNIAVIACGANLERIGCPHCGASIDTEWWHDLLEAHFDEGFANLAVKAPTPNPAAASASVSPLRRWTSTSRACRPGLRRRHVEPIDLR